MVLLLPPGTRKMGRILCRLAKDTYSSRYFAIIPWKTVIITVYISGHHYVKGAPVVVQSIAGTTLTSHHVASMNGRKTTQ